MKLRGKYEKHQIDVGLSETLPLLYRGPDQKYTLADAIAPGRASVRYQKETLEWELIETTAELSDCPGRFRCHQLINAMPEEGLREVEADLRDTYEHYIRLALSAETARALPGPKQVIAHVTGKVLR